MGAFLLVSLAFQAASANSFIRPWRPLTEEDKLEYSTSTARAVLIGRVATIGPDHRLMVEPVEWLKGGGSMAQTTIGMWPTMPVARVSGAWAGQTVLFFLAPNPVYLKDFDWGIMESPSAFLGGASPVSDGELGDLRRRLLTTIERQSLDSLGHRADLVAIGYLNAEHVDCEMYGTTEPCNVLHVESVLKGAEASNRVPIYFPVVAMREGRSVFFLRRDGRGSYELLFGGQLLITGVDGLPDGNTIASLRDRLHRAPRRGRVTP